MNNASVHLVCSRDIAIHLSDNCTSIGLHSPKESHINWVDSAHWWHLKLAQKFALLTISMDASRAVTASMTRKETKELQLLPFRYERTACVIKEIFKKSTITVLGHEESQCGSSTVANHSQPPENCSTCTMIDNTLSHYLQNKLKTWQILLEQ